MEAQTVTKGTIGQNKSRYNRRGTIGQNKSRYDRRGTIKLYTKVKSSMGVIGEFQNDPGVPGGVKTKK